MLPPGRRARWLRALLVVVAAVAAVVAVLAGVFAWSFSGGWDGIRPEAQPDDRRVVAARTQALKTLPAQAAADTDLARSVVAGDDAVTVLVDDCEPGRNDWKNHTGYTLRCEATSTTVLLPSGVSSPAEVAARLDPVLTGAGWQPAHESTRLTAEPAGTLTGTYVGPGGRTLEVGVTDTGDDPLYTELRGTAHPSSPGVAGDVDDALSGHRGVAVVVRSGVTYFQD